MALETWDKTGCKVTAVEIDAAAIDLARRYVLRDGETIDPLPGGDIVGVYKHLSESDKAALFPPPYGGERVRYVQGDALAFVSDSVERLEQAWWGSSDETYKILNENSYNVVIVDVFQEMDVKVSKVLSLQ